MDTVANSARSGSWSQILMAILTQGGTGIYILQTSNEVLLHIKNFKNCAFNPEWKAEHYSDVAMLLSSCEDVYSADVPTAIKVRLALIKFIVEMLRPAVLSTMYNLTKH